MNPFNDLFIFEMANNHQGSLEHGLRIIQEMSEIARRHQVNAAVKLQYRDLDTMIHPAYKTRQDVKHIPRFLETRLADDQNRALVTAIHDQGMTCVITPFDERSVARAVDHGVDVLKVASCSALDWPLLNEIIEAEKPVIVSTGGIGLHDIDRVVTFFSHRDVPLAILHCIGVYPAPAEQLSMNFISKMKGRYRGIPVGYSGHENPDNVDAVMVAASKGAVIFERHVGCESDTIKLNAYSSTPEQVDRWVAAALRARAMEGSVGVKPVLPNETASLRTLMRGVYAAQPIPKGKKIDPDDVYFAMPCTEASMTSGEFGQYRATFVASRDYAVNDPVKEVSPTDYISKVRSIVHDAKGMLYEAQIELGRDITIELSHHFGIDSFRQYGAVLASVVNRSYCKKVILVFPGQQHPSHYHRKKEETFQVLWGELEVDLEGVTSILHPGDKMLVEPGQAHAFRSKTGVIFEEVSTTYERDDSVYVDPAINGMDPMERKTLVENW